MAKDKNKFTYLEKVAIGIIVVLILIIVFLVFDEKLIGICFWITIL